MTEKGKVVEVLYTNWKKKTSLRRIKPLEIYLGSNEYHPEEQYLLRCIDVDKNAERTFAMKDIKSWDEK